MPELIVGRLLFFALAVTLWCCICGIVTRRCCIRSAWRGSKRASCPGAALAGPWSPRVYLLRGLIWSLAGAGADRRPVRFFVHGGDRQEPRCGRKRRPTQARNIARNLDIPIGEARQIVEKDADGETRGARARPYPCWASFR